jgi:hypothetical protein
MTKLLGSYKKKGKQSHQWENIAVEKRPYSETVLVLVSTPSAEIHMLLAIAIDDRIYHR